MEALLTRFALPRRTLLVCVAVSAALIAGAHAFERVGGMAPCALCLDQREAHWTAIAAGVVLLGFAALGASRVVAAGLGALALVYAFSAGLGGFHAGVEWGFWPGPDACAPATTASLDGIDAGALLSSLDRPGPEGPSCSEAAWRMLGVSMAGYNALISAGLALVAGAACYVFARGVDRRVVRA